MVTGELEDEDPVLTCKWDHLKARAPLQLPQHRCGRTSLLVGNQDDGSVETIAIDEWVAQRAIPRIDFIKLDVEGAELNVLRAAEKTIRAFRPRLAVSVYHKEDDLIAIPDFLRGLNCGYKLLLDHFTIHNEETSLFADPQAARPT
jgi:hypothetical protein